MKAPQFLCVQLGKKGAHDRWCRDRHDVGQVAKTQAMPPGKMVSMACLSHEVEEVARRALQREGFGFAALAA